MRSTIYSALVAQFDFEFLLSVRNDANERETKAETNTVYGLLDYCDYGQNEGIFLCVSLHAYRDDDGDEDGGDGGNESIEGNK